MQEEFLTGDPYETQLPGLSGGGSGTAAAAGGYGGRPSDPDAVLAGLDPEQRAVATALHGPVCVLAGAGTGKTRAITHRIAYGVRSGVFQPAQVLAVTFTARAAGEMRGRLRQLGAEGVQARTFHSAALRQLQYFWPRAVGGEVPRLLERKVQLVAEAAGRTGLRVQRTELRDLTSEIEWAKVTQIVPDDYPVAVVKSGREAPRDPAEIARVYATYEQTKRDRNVIDFEDVLLLTAAILEDRPEIAERVRGQYRHFTVDEYQDVSPLQQRLLDQWTGGGGASLCVVGDASQTIYSFTGATPSYLLNFRHKHPDATVVKLVRDYRSTPQVVHLANGLLAQARGEAARHRLELVSQREAGPEPVYVEYQDEPTEAETTAQRIKELMAKGVRASEIAVLFRTNGQSEVYEQALADLGLAYQLKGAERFFERPEVREAGLLLRGAARAGNDPVTVDAPDLAAEVRAVLGTRGFTPTPPAGSGAVRERWESLAALVRLAEEFEAGRRSAGEPADLAAYVGELDARAAAQHAPAVEGVTLASLHAAKGLEWDAVFLVGLTEGTLPIIYAKTDEQLEEERRLLYVGATRARVHLSLSWALSRSPGGRASRKPSRFLDGLRPGSGSAGGRSGGGGSRGSVTGGAERSAPRKARGPVKCRVCDRTLTEAVERKLRRCEDCPSSMDEGLYERLREWRAGQAKKHGVPAYVVFTDATLMAIAEDVPSSTRELTLISGVGAMKLDKYGAAVLSLCAGEEPEEESAEPADHLAGEASGDAARAPEEEAPQEEPGDFPEDS